MQHPTYLQDARHFLLDIDEISKEHGPFDKEKLYFRSVLFAVYSKLLP